MMNNIINIDGERYIKLSQHKKEFQALTTEVERLKETLSEWDAWAEMVKKATPPAKPVVWVRRMASANYYRVTKSGDPFYTYSDNIDPFERFGWWETTYKGIAEVRIWEPKCEACGQVLP